MAAISFSGTPIGLYADLEWGLMDRIRQMPATCSIGAATGIIEESSRSRPADRGDPALARHLRLQYLRARHVDAGLAPAGHRSQAHCVVAESLPVISR